MKIDLEEKSKQLKNLVAQFDSKMFLGELSGMKQFISPTNQLESLKGLKSPLRQFYYLASLNLTSSPENITKDRFSDEEWEEIKSLLIEIEEGYIQYFLPDGETEISEEWIKKRKVAMPSFLNYFNQTALNYEEQVIERIKLYFNPLEKEIINQFGLSIDDFISIYNYIDSVPNKFLEEKIHKKEGQQTWEEFAESMIEQGIMPDKWQEHMPEHFSNFFNFLYDHGSMLRFTFEQLEQQFGPEKAKAFLDTFTIERNETGFLYYTEKNPLFIKPIFKVGENEYQCLEYKQVVHAIYDTLFEFCFNDKKLKERLLAIRGKKFEDKIVEVFQSFFNNEATVYKGFYTQDGHEQDLLFLIKGLALIVEAKSSKRKEPKRNPDTAYPFIEANFNETIQKGYDQAFRIKEKFIDRETIKIYSDQKLKNHVIDLKPKNFHSAYSIIVTQEVFGHIQIHLSELLDVYEDDTYPWSVSLDDLEVILLYMKKEGLNLRDFIKFLQVRECLHENVTANDELDVCAGILSHKITKEVAKVEHLLVIPPEYAGIFDEHYHKGGLGFKEEKNMKYKTSNKYMVLGSHR
ncbi:hypothetical protein [Pontibacter oryzae]|uniref:NERD domain-containing protein n=1 Tax=Pontibacter oryzae TaxID=2304593 RepID=A0A399SJA9_9BACT|nr:hypothetical protein [Pontibacter oryzae]RIJ41835.1 hypothetical protein D1627_07415 [Pontibacter oryzae]